MKSHNKAASIEAVHNFQREFCNHIRTQGKNSAPVGTTKHGMLTYRKLMLSNVSGFVDACFPVLQKIVGVRTWKKWKLDFYETSVFTTPYFREIPKYFVLWLKNEAKKGSIFDYLAALAHWEWVELYVSQKDSLKTNSKKALMINPTAALVRYDYPVHTFAPKKKVLMQDTFLLSWRLKSGEVKFMELNKFSFKLLKKISKKPDFELPTEAKPMIEALEKLQVIWH